MAKPPSPSSDPDTGLDIDSLFENKSMGGSNFDKYARILKQAKKLALLIKNNCPDIEGRNNAIKKVVEASMWARKTLSLN